MGGKRSTGYILPWTRNLARHVPKALASGVRSPGAVAGAGSAASGVRPVDRDAVKYERKVSKVDTRKELKDSERKVSKVDTRKESRDSERKVSKVDTRKEFRDRPVKPGASPRARSAEAPGRTRS
eukprot:4993540-Amphidinium_carterae.1